MTGPLPFRITERDVGILQAIARYRFLTAELLHHLVGGSERGVRNRLRLLSAHAYLVRLQSVITEPFAYGLGNKGARLLADHAPHINGRLDWTAENDRTQYFIDHTLEVAEMMLRFEIATRDHAIRLADHHELLPEMPERTRNARDPFCLRVTIRHHEKALTIPVVPDRLFALMYSDTRHNFALELDRGSMDIWANRLVGKSSIRRKLIGYFRAREQKRFAEVWGFKSFRVLTVTTSEDRITNMIAAQRRVASDCPPGLFLYSTLERIQRHGALGPAWITSKSDNISLRHDNEAERISKLSAPISINDTAPSLRAAGVKRELREPTRA